MAAGTATRTRGPRPRLITSTRTPAILRTPEWVPVKSDTLDSIAYYPEYRDLLVVFKSGGYYLYKDVEPELVEKLRKPHPWRVVGPEVLAHPYEKLASIRTRPLKKRAKKEEK